MDISDHPGHAVHLAVRTAEQPRTRFHNHLYAELGLNYLYNAFTTTDLPAPAW